jgi:hypothetical protein
MLTKSLFRVWFPLLLCGIGVLIYALYDFSGFGVDGFAGFCGAGAAMWLTNTLWRMGVSGEQDRDDEAEARRYLADHGHWPDESESPKPQ